MENNKIRVLMIRYKDYFDKRNEYRGVKCN